MFDNVEQKKKKVLKRLPDVIILPYMERKSVGNRSGKPTSYTWDSRIG
jgi:hypothetical protein